MAILWFGDLNKTDIDIAGGKGANLGELVRAGLPVPPGFVVTADLYNEILVKNGMDNEIKDILDKVNVDDSKALISSSKKIRKLLKNMELPKKIQSEILKNYKKLCSSKSSNCLVAVRSSATAEDLPGASFAGQQETFLNVNEDGITNSIKECWSSLYTSRAIFYREKKGFKHEDVSIAVVIQRMINADKSGVMFTVHPATGEKEKLILESNWGLGESVVSGAVTPDHYVIDKKTGKIITKEIMDKESMIVRSSADGGTLRQKVPKDRINKQVLKEDEIKKLAEFGKLIENHYEFPQDIEWAIEGDETYLLQSRPITVFYQDEKKEKESNKDVLLKGLAVSPGLGSGKVQIIFSTDELEKVKAGDILVTTMTNPDMVPAMRRSSAIVTEEGGMTCHAAIVSRELGTPCIVGTSDATKVLSNGDEITVDGSRGIVYKGITKIKDNKLQERGSITAPQIVTGTEIKTNISIPDIAHKIAPSADGVGLLRVEHMILGIGKHPVKFIQENNEEELIEKIAEGVRTVAEAFYPKPVWYRSLDAPTDEFRSLEGGQDEPVEHNPMLGWRGIRRGLDQEELLIAEFKAIKKVMDEGYTNICTMIPLVINPEELRRAKEIAVKVGLQPHKELKFGIMVETPACALTIEDFIKEGLDFISFGTNDLTQYTLALDRNNERVAKLFSEKHKGVLKLIEHVIKKCKKAGVETSICGQAGSYPDVVEKLVGFGITSVSANPDAVQIVRETVARTEKRLLLDSARGL